MFVWRFSVKMPKHHCCAYKCSNSEAKKKPPDKYPEFSDVTFHCFPPDNEKTQYAPGMNERERRRRWIVACRLESLSVTRHNRICSKHFEGGLGPTKANPIPTIFDFPKHLQPKKVKQRQDPEERRLKGVMNASMKSATQKQSRPRPSQSKASACLNLREPTLYQENQLKQMKVEWVSKSVIRRCCLHHPS